MSESSSGTSQLEEEINIKKKKPLCRRGAIVNTLVRGEPEPIIKEEEKEQVELKKVKTSKETATKKREISEPEKII